MYLQSVNFDVGVASYGALGMPPELLTVYVYFSGHFKATKKLRHLTPKTPI